MEDDLEDEIFYQTLVVHLRLLSKLMMSVPLQTALVAREFRLYLSRPEALAACGVLAVCLLSLLNSAAVVNYGNWCRPWLTRVQLALGLKLFRLPVRSPLAGLGGSDKGTTWELRKGDVAVYSVQGRRPKMEDRFRVESTQVRDGSGRVSSMSLYGVYDGHGGDSAADFVEKTLFKDFIARLGKTESTAAAAPPVAKPSKSEGGNGADAGDPASAPPAGGPRDYGQMLAEEILSVDKQLLLVAKAKKDLAGTTALVAIVHDDKLIVANVGDSRGVACDWKGNSVPLSFDHKPQQLKEQKRIKQAGGFVTFNGVWRVAGILATSRALGDYPLKDRQLIIADPDVLTFELAELRPLFVILASDGLWDVFSNEEAVAFIRQRLHEPHFGAKSLTQQAFQRGSSDNITVLVVCFDKPAAS